MTTDTIPARLLEQARVRPAAPAYYIREDGIWKATSWSDYAKLVKQAGRALIATHIDSWENGAQNWTTAMPAEFRRRRGYDIVPWLPVVTGRVVSSLELSERFLWDLRQTISDLVVENYAGHLRTLAQAQGLRLSIEAYGGPCDDLPYAGRADEPMCEFWVGGALNGTCKEMASAAHTYGKPILGAESFTATDAERWKDHPATLKALGDLKSLFCQIFQLCRLPLLQCSGHCLKGDLPTCREPVLFDSNCVHPCAISGMREAAR